MFRLYGWFQLFSIVSNRFQLFSIAFFFLTAKAQRRKGAHQRVEFFSLLAEVRITIGAKRKSA